MKLLLIYPYIRGLSGKYPAILNISRTVCVVMMELSSQSEETLLCICEKVTLSWGQSIGSETPLTETVYCVTVAFTMTERADQLHHNKAPAHCTALLQTFLAKHHITQVCQPPLQPRFGFLRIQAFPKDKIAVERVEICECDGHTVHKLTQRRLTADLLAPQESDCSRIHSQVSSDWLPSYIKTTRPVLEIFRMAGYFPYSPRVVH